MRDAGGGKLEIAVAARAVPPSRPCRWDACRRQVAGRRSEGRGLFVLVEEDADGKDSCAQLLAKIDAGRDTASRDPDIEVARCGAGMLRVNKARRPLGAGRGKENSFACHFAGSLGADSADKALGTLGRSYVPTCPIASCTSASTERAHGASTVSAMGDEGVPDMRRMRGGQGKDGYESIRR